MRFYMVYSHWLWQLPQNALYLDIIITGYILVPMLYTFIISSNLDKKLLTY